MRSDIRNDRAKPWLVVGWFTPDYQECAERFASNLLEVGAPFHLYAKEKCPGGWDTRRKPSVALQAMRDHPGKTIVLMDVDCIVWDDIEPATLFPGDVALSIKARQGHKAWRTAKHITLLAGSRVIVFKPTVGARAFVREWEHNAAQWPTGGDEASLAWTYLLNPGISCSHLNPRYVGREIGSADVGTVIWHESAHDKHRFGGIKGILRAVEKRFLRAPFRALRAKPKAHHSLG